MFVCFFHSITGCPLTPITPEPNAVANCPTDPTVSGTQLTIVGLRFTDQTIFEVGGKSCPKADGTSIRNLGE